MLFKYKHNSCCYIIESTLPHVFHNLEQRSVGHLILGTDDILRKMKTMANPHSNYSGREHLVTDRILADIFNVAEDRKNDWRP